MSELRHARERVRRQRHWQARELVVGSGGGWVGRHLCGACNKLSFTDPVRPCRGKRGSRDTRRTLFARTLKDHVPFVFANQKFSIQNQSRLESMGFSREGNFSPRTRARTARG